MEAATVGGLIRQVAGRIDAQSNPERALNRLAAGWRSNNQATLSRLVGREGIAAALALPDALESCTHSAVATQSLAKHLVGSGGDVVMAWVESRADDGELRLAPMLAMAAEQGQAQYLEQAARARVAAGPTEDALACLPLAGDADWLLSSADGAMLGRVELLLWNAGARGASIPELGVWLTEQRAAKEQLLLAGLTGSLSSRIIAARTLSVAADGFVHSVPKELRAELLRVARRLAAHPLAQVSMPAARGLGRLASHFKEARMHVLRGLLGSNLAARRRALTALASMPEPDRPLLELHLDALLDDEEADPWDIAALAIAIPHLACEHRVLWERLHQQLVGRRFGAEVLYSASRGLCMLARANKLDRVAGELLFDLRARARRAKPRTVAEAMLWHQIYRETNFLEGVPPDPSDVELVLDNLVDVALRLGASRVEKKLGPALRVLLPTVEASLELAQDGDDVAERARALVSLESCTRAFAASPWDSLLRAAAADGSRLNKRRDAAREELLELAATTLAAAETPDFAVHRGVLRMLGQLLDEQAGTPARGPAVARIVAAIDDTPWLAKLKSRDRSKFAKPLAELLWRLLDATRVDPEREISRVYGRFAAWWVLACNAGIELLSVVARSEAAAREDDALFADAAADELRRAIAGESVAAQTRFTTQLTGAPPTPTSGGWDDAVSDALEELDAADTLLAQALKLLADALRELAQSGELLTVASLDQALARLAEARAALEVVLRDPLQALGSVGAPESRQVTAAPKHLEMAHRIRRRGVSAHPELPELLVGDLGPLLTPVALRAVKQLLERHADQEHGVQSRRERIIGRYRVIERLGGGYAGDVWLIADLETERRFVMKTPNIGRHKGTKKEKIIVDALFAEAAALKSIYHPRVASFHDYGLHEGLPYLVVEYLIGIDLGVLTGARVLSLKEMKPIVADVAAGLSALHAGRLVHRDVKPGNVFLRFDLPPDTKVDAGECRDARILEAVVIDFGFVRAFIEGEEAKAEHVGGTLGYMAPEQVVNDMLDAKTDVYGLAATVYAAMTDRSFFDEMADKMQRARAHLEQEPLADPRRRLRIPEPCFELLRVATQLDPKARPTMREFADAFAEL